MKLITGQALPSLSRATAAVRQPVRVAALQMHWVSDPAEHIQNLREGIRLAAEAGAQIVFLPELTLSRYMADVRPTGLPRATAESLSDGPTFALAASAAREHGIWVHASLFESVERADGRGHNTAILVDPQGNLRGRTRKLHIPVTAGYYEDEYFAPGPDEDPYPVYDLTAGATPLRLGMPTCWDEWFPEVTRAYSLAGAEVLVYPTAIGSEPDYPDFDTAPLWKHVITANGINSGTFMVVPNRWGNEGLIDFYGSSFISDPYGRVLVEAGRAEDAVLVADLDLDQRRDWLDLFPFLATRRPDTYEALAQPVTNPRGSDGRGVDGGIAGIST
jgi:N-carbamoylputrescine amidase